jgi:predicted nucleic acid-binding protein
MAAADVFMDSAGFLALWDAADEQHAAAVQIQAELGRKRRRFLTTDYVADETVTLLLVRHSHAAAADFLDTLARSEALRLEWVGPDRFHAAAGFFRRHADKEWSFTDCVSFTLMHELNIRDCFTTDHHFQQAGFTSLLGNRVRRQGRSGFS